MNANARAQMVIWFILILLAGTILGIMWVALTTDTPDPSQSEVVEFWHKGMPCIRVYFSERLDHTGVSCDWSKYRE